MQTSGLVLDVYDDFSGETLRALYPSFDSIPGKVKQAHVMTAPERDRLPDDVFALVLVNNGEKLRKYACIDEGNTALSVEYFVKNAHKLPLAAQKVAAANLQVACGWYDIAPPAELEKIALGLGTAMSAMMAAPVIKGTHEAIHNNMAATRALEQAGAGVVQPAHRNVLLGKTAEVSGTPLSPMSQPTGAPPAAKAVINKTARVGHLVAHQGADVPPDVVHPPTKEQAPKHPQAGHLRPTVDVSNMDPPRLLTEKKAMHYALPSQGRYPLDSYAHVKEASRYFDEYVKHMTPAMRHEYASNLVKRAGALNLPVSATAHKYGATDFAPAGHIKAAFDARRLELSGNEDALMLLEGVEAVAMGRMQKEASAVMRGYNAQEVVAVLAEFDKVAGLEHYYDRSIPDPFYSILGIEKTAEDAAVWSDVVANEMVTREDLERLAKIGAFSVKTTFGGDFQEEFLKDPVGMYKSLPLDQKKMLIRMANSTQPGVERTYY